MLTKRRIKKFCIKSIGIFIHDPEVNITVRREKGLYILRLENLRAPAHIVQREWDRVATGTKYERVYVEIIGH